MKRLFIIMAALAVAASCSKQEAENGTSNDELVKMTFTAESTPLTKTALDANFHITWNTSDKINVFSGDEFTTKTDFTVTGTESNAHIATFEGLASQSGSYYALFPAQEGASITSAGVITATLPAAQNATAGSFGPEANISVASISSGNDLVFKNVGALLAINIQATDVTGLKVEALGSGSLSGTATINYNSGSPASTVTTGNSYVETTVSGAGTYYLVAYPGTYTGGFKITLTKPGYIATMTNTKSITLDRNDNVLLATVPADLSEKWNIDFTPGETVTIKGLTLDPEQEVTYISSTYYDATMEGRSSSSDRGDATDALDYNYEVWAKLGTTDKIYFETEKGVKFAINTAGTAVAPINSAEEGTALSVSDSPYRIRIKLPEGSAEILRIGIVNYSVYTTDISQNLTYDSKGTWKADNYVIRYEVKTWDPILTRYHFSIWFNWKGGKTGANYNVWQNYGACNVVNNSKLMPASDDLSLPYYYVTPYKSSSWDEVFYMGSWIYDTTASTAPANNSKKGTISLHMNSTYGHFTQGFTNVVDNN